MECPNCGSEKFKVLTDDDGNPFGACFDCDYMESNPLIIISLEKSEIAEE